MSATDVARSITRKLGFEVVRHQDVPPDFQPADVALLKQVRPYTMTSAERVFAAASAARYIADAAIPGAIVECGVWRGGSSMAIALSLLGAGVDDRDLYLFDTYEGMSAPTEVDKDFRDEPAQIKFDLARTAADASGWCAADIDDVRANMTSTRYPMDRVHLVPG